MRYLPQLMALLPLVAADESGRYGFQHILGQSWEPTLQQDAPPESSQRCKISHLSAHQKAKDPIYFSTSSIDSLAGTRISGINATVWEQFYFDSVSDEADASVAMLFARDASYTALGKGHLRMELDLVWQNGTKFTQAEFMDEATVRDCDGEMTGLFKSPGRAYSFHISKDFQTARVEIDASPVKGSFTLRATGPPHYPGGELHPSSNASTLTSPSLHFVEIISAGRFEANFIIGGSPFAFKGIGGHDHGWAAHSWFSIVKGWHIVRAVVGPYSMTLWAPISLANGVTYSMGFLAKGGEKIWGKQILSSQVLSKEDDYVRLGKTYGGRVLGTLDDKNTGYVLEFGCPKRSEHWKFDLEHNNVAFEMGFGAGSGLTGFTSWAKGGLVGGKQYNGVAFGEQVKLPGESPKPPILRRSLLIPVFPENNQ